MDRTGGGHLPFLQHGPVQRASGRDTSVLGSQQPLGRGSKPQSRDGPESVLEHKHQYILCAECEKKETTRPMETEQAMGAQTSRVSFRRAAIAGRQSHQKGPFAEQGPPPRSSRPGVTSGVEVAFLA